MSRGELLRVLLAAAALSWALADARSRREGLAPLPVAAARIDSPPPPRGRPAPPPVAGAGTAESPARLPFARLEFPGYDPAPLRVDPTPLPAEAFPPPLPQLDGRVVRVVGYPLVFEADGGAARELLLTRYPPGCCFGPRPVLDEWIAVTVAAPDDAAELDGNEPAAAVGVLEVGERVLDGGRVESLYRLRSARLEPAGGRSG